MALVDGTDAIANLAALRMLTAIVTNAARYQHE